MLFNLKQKINNTMIICIILFIWNTIYMIEAISMGSPIRKGRVDVNFFPIVISCMMYLFTLYLLVHSFKQNKELTEINFTNKSRPILIIVFTIIYILLLKSIGYMLSSILYIFSIVSIFDSKKRSLYKKIIYSVIIAILIFLLYEKIFAIRLPKLGGIF
ncbi:MAG TPA: tripartite tricarboxylate transporter TctB family protein [Atribacterota bacterium]|nr:tripartite tricarboxylate transporter TctB family protein [Atribacterota bacterium]